LERHADVHRFVTLLAARRLLRDVEHEHRRVSLSRLIAGANQAWHGVRLGQPDWGEDSHSIAFSVELKQEKLLLHLILNAYWEPLDFALPAADGNPWQRWTTPPCPRPMTSWSGRRPSRFPIAPIGPDRGPSSCSMPSSADTRRLRTRMRAPRAADHHPPLPHRVAPQDPAFSPRGLNSAAWVMFAPRTVSHPRCSPDARIIPRACSGCTEFFSLP
jgi:hypothetical protein